MRCAVYRREGAGRADGRRGQIGAGYTNEEGRKVGVSGAALAPAGVVLDAELTLATPAQLWLSSGIRALDHAVGVYARFPASRFDDSKL